MPRHGNRAVALIGERHPVRADLHAAGDVADGHQGIRDRRDGKLGAQPRHRVGHRPRNCSEETGADDGRTLGLMFTLAVFILAVPSLTSAMHTPAATHERMVSVIGD